MIKLVRFFPAVAAVVLFAVPLAAQATGGSQNAQSEAASRQPLQPVKITVVISRYQGETRTSNLPYTMWVNAGDRSNTNLRMTANVPVPRTAVAFGEGETAQAPVTSFSYQPVGTNIDCQVLPLDDGRYIVELTVNDTSLIESGATTRDASTKPPSIRTFTSNNSVILRDGQTTEYVTAADTVTGEVVKLDVSLNVIG